MADEVIKISELDGASTLTGAEIFVFVQGGVTVQGTLDELLVYVGAGGGSEVVNGAKKTALKLNTNWVNPASAGDTYYPIMTLNIVTGQNEHDYYIGFDSENTTTLYRYAYEKIDSVLTWIRTPIAFSIPTA